MMRAWIALNAFKILRVMNNKFHYFSHLRLFACAALLFASTAGAKDVVRYTVKQGDTLWQIAEQLLAEPWNWRGLWRQNPSIDHPDLIYPGDVLLVSDEGLKVVRNTRLRVEKRVPEVRIQPTTYAITTLDTTYIQPFLTQSIIVDAAELNRMGYVLEGIDGQILLGRLSAFYARGISGKQGQIFSVYRSGQEFRDPVSGIDFGVEGDYLGRAMMIEPGEISRLELIEANQEVRPGDRLQLTVGTALMPHYFPQPADAGLNARVMAIPRGVSEAGQYDVLTLAVGTNDGLEVGDVVQITRESGTTKDPVTGEIVHLPVQRSGTAMVFQTYARLSYAVLMRAIRPVHIGDRAKAP